MRVGKSDVQHFGVLKSIVQLTHKEKQHFAIE